MNANLGEGDAPNEAVPGVADADRTGAPVLLGNEDGPSAESDSNEKPHRVNTAECKLFTSK